MGGRRLNFEIDARLETGLLTAHAGVPGLIEAFRQTGAAAVIDRFVLLTVAGTLVRHARPLMLLLRLTSKAARTLADPPGTTFALSRPASVGV